VQRICGSRGRDAVLSTSLRHHLELTGCRGDRNRAGHVSTGQHRHAGLDICHDGAVRVALSRRVALSSGDQRDGRPHRGNKASSQPGSAVMRDQQHINRRQAG